jgi:hypothetical protein
VARDPGIQTTTGSDDQLAAPAGAGEIVQIRVTVDLGEQSASPIDHEPVDEEGDRT